MRTPALDPISALPTAERHGLTFVHIVPSRANTTTLCRRSRLRASATRLGPGPVHHLTWPASRFRSRGRSVWRVSANPQPFLGFLGGRTPSVTDSTSINETPDSSRPCRTSPGGSTRRSSGCATRSDSPPPFFRRTGGREPRPIFGSEPDSTSISRFGVDLAPAQ